MSETILGGDFTVYYTGDTGTGGSKQIRWTTGTTIYTVKELYKALQNLFDDSSGGEGSHMDEGIPISTQTPTEYLFGRIETNDANAWFIDEESVKHLKTGAITSMGWERVQDSNTGIVEVPRTGSTIVNSDIGYSISGSGSGGVLLAIRANGDLIIRPTNSSSTHNWAGPSGSILCNGHTDTQNGAAITGEFIWSNIYTLGTIAGNTKLYIYQNNTQITPWWLSGHIDVLVLVHEDGIFIDEGILTIFARQYTTLYDHYTVVAIGGRNPIPLSTSSDINNTTGYRNVTVSGVSGQFTDGEVISGGLSGASAIITAANGTPNTTSLDYYLIGDLTDFQASETITGATSGKTGTSGTFSDIGPTNLSPDPTFNFGATQQDIGDGDGNKPYDLSINCGGNTLKNFYEFTKYITGQGAEEPLFTDYGHNGASYITTGEIRIPYNSQTVNFLEGATLTGQTSGATGVIVADHDNGTSGVLVVRDVRGTFDDTTPEVITDDQGTPGSATIVSGGIETTLVSKTAPFGTFAGGKFFGARGVWIYGIHADDSNNYQLVDSNNIPRDPPSTVPIVVSSLQSGDRVSVFLATTGGDINKTYLTSTASDNNLGDPDFIVNETVPLDSPTTGSLRIVDNNSNPTLSKEYRIRYSSRSGSTFTLANQTGTMNNTGGTTTPTNVHQSGKSFTTTVQKGDLIINTSRSNAVSYVTAVVDDTNLTISPAISGQASGDNYEINAVPVSTTTGDTAYIPYIDTESTGSSVSVSVQYDGDKTLLARVRIKGIVPYSINSPLTSTGASFTAIRNPDDIA